MQARLFKSLFSGALTLTVLFAFSGCASVTDSVKKQTSSAAQTTQDYGAVTKASLVETPAVHSISFAADGSQNETEYMYQDDGSSVMKGHRFADKSAGWVYYFGFSNPVSSASLNLDIAGQYLISVSADAKNWTVLATSEGTPGRNGLYEKLDSVLGNSIKAFYIKFSDRVSSDGFGPSLYVFTLSYEPASGVTDNGPQGPNVQAGKVSYDVSFGFATNGSQPEKEYLYDDKSSGIMSGDHRYADATAYWVYAFSFPDTLKAAEMDLDISNEYVVSGSTDGHSWVTLSTSTGNPSRSILHVSLAPLLGGSARTFYIRFSDRTTSDGFGPSLWNFTLNYNLSKGGSSKPSSVKAPAVTKTGSAYFTANGSAAEKKYMADDHSTGVLSGSHRFADKTAYWVYYFKFPGTLKTASVDLDIAGQYVVSGSIDGKNWTNLAVSSGTPGRAMVNVHLDALAAGKSAVLYLRFSDRVTSDGFGPSLWSLDLSTQLEDGRVNMVPSGPQAAPTAKNAVQFAADGGSAETEYMFEDGGSFVSKDHRFADRSAYWVYYFKYPGAVSSSAAVCDIGGQYQISGSTDGQHWTTLAKASGTPGRNTVSVDLSALVGSRSEIVYLKFSDRDPSDGFGPSLWSLRMEYNLADGTGNANLVGPTRNALRFAADGGADESRYMFIDRSSGIFGGDHRYADNSAYWIYYFRFPSSVATAGVDLDMQGQYQISGSTDGKTWQTLVAANGTAGRGIVHVDLTALLGTDSRTVYLKFSDHNPSDGFGPGLWNFNLTYILTSGQQDDNLSGPVKNAAGFAADGGADESKYMLMDLSSGIFGEDHRYADNSAYWVYYFRFPDTVASAGVDLDLGGQYQVSGSTDGTAWTTLATADGTAGRGIVHVDLTALTQTGATSVYLKFTDRDPSDGFGPGLWNLNLTYILASGQADADVSGPTTNSLQFAADGGATEQTYLYADNHSQLFNVNDHRYADNYAYWVYGFKFYKTLADASVDLDIGGQYQIAASTDAKNWQIVSTADGTAGRGTVHLNLTSLIGSGAQTVYLKFSDHDPSDGFGPGLWDLTLAYKCMDGQADTAPLSAGKITAVTNSFTLVADGGANEASYLLVDESSGVMGNDHRYADNNAFWVYEFRFAGLVNSAGVDLDIAGQYEVSGSTDGSNWTVLATADGAPGRGTVHVDFSSLSATPSANLYLKFTDRDPSDGFGPGFWGMTMSYTMQDGGQDTGPSGPLQNTLSFLANGTAGELPYLYDDHSSGIFGNDHRFADNSAYWVYCFNFDDFVASLHLNLDIGGQYNIECSSDGSTWKTLAVADGTPGRSNLRFDLTTFLGEPYRKLYLRFSDAQPADGFGPGLWGLGIQYTLRAGEQASQQTTSN